MISGLTYTLAVVALSYLAICVFLLVAQRSMIYLPPPNGPARAGEQLTLMRGDASVQVAVRNIAAPRALIYFGGNAEDVSRTLPALAAIFPDRALYLMHYRGYGGSTGTPTEAALFGDAVALYERIAPSHQEIALLGRSLGSGVAAYLASQRAVASLVLVTPFDSIQNVAAAALPLVPMQWLLKDKYESWRYAENIRAPTLVLVAQHDRIVAPARSQALLTFFPAGVARLEIMQNADHNSISEHAEFARLLRSASGG